MSRKWERMVRKNTKNINSKRKKLGQTSIHGSNKETVLMYKGRSWILALCLLFIGVFSLFAFKRFYGDDPMYLVTAGLYIALSFIVYFLRRPFLKISGKQISSRRFGGERYVNADEIESLQWNDRRVIVNFKSRKAPWIFSRVFQQFHIDEMTKSIAEFANRNSVPVQEQSN